MVDTAVDDAAPAWVAFGHRALLRLAGNDGEEEFEAARARFAASLDEPGSFATLAANARLSTTDAEVLALAASCEIDLTRSQLLASLQHDGSPARVALDTVARALAPDGGAVAAVGSDGRLRRAAFITVEGEGPWADQRVAVHPTVIWALLGDDGRDADLPDDTCTVSAADAGGAPLTVVTGRDRVRRWQAGSAATSGDRFLASAAVLENRAWAALVREATLTGCGIIVDIGDELPAEGRRWIERADHLAWAVCSASDQAIADLPRRSWRAVQADDHDTTEAEWRQHLGSLPRTHPLGPQQLELVGRAIGAYGGDLDAAVRRLVSARLQRLSRRIRPSRGWDDIVLSPDRLGTLRSIVERYRHADQVYGEWGFAATPSRGLVALFSGPSGTGKTLAAEIIGGELGLDVFKLDLSAVVSKYIGETEKNLAEVFDAASAGNLLLFFDEADALFGKRSEVKDARDRYANIEVSYLLQRLEAYDGLVVMATNFERNVDEAFLRRIHARVEFVMPGIAERQAIWERNLPKTAPLEDVDARWLAQRFDLSGASIRNAAIQAAFIAAAGAGTISMECAVLGIARELRKLGRLVKPAEFAPFQASVAAELASTER